MPPKRRDAETQEEIGLATSASKVTLCKASSLKKDDYVMIEGCPCKILDTSVSKTGKHGGAKVAEIDEEDGDNKVHIKALNDCNETETVVIDKTTEEGRMWYDTLKGGYEQKTYMITVLEAMGQLQMVSVKEATQ